MYTAPAIGTVVILLVASVVAAPAMASAAYSSETNCNCIIFRLDDVIDWSLSSVNIAIMDHFIAEQKPLSIQIIVSNFGNSYPYGKVYNKTLEGHKAGLFEIGIHHWGREMYNATDYETQFSLLNQSNDKLQKLFGARSILFAPPHNEFNADTIRAMAATGITTFSATYTEERATSNPYKVSAAYDTGKAFVHLSDMNGTKIYHVPTGISYLGLIKAGYSSESMADELIRRAEFNVEKYGYAIIGLHPADFAVTDPSLGYSVNRVDPAKFQALIDTIDRLESKGYSFGNISSVLPSDV